MCETVEELRVFEDDCAVGSRTTGETWKTTIDVGTGADFDVADGETESCKDLPDCHALSDRLDALTRAHASDLLVLEACKHIR